MLPFKRTLSWYETNEPLDDYLSTALLTLWLVTAFRPFDHVIVIVVVLFPCR